MASRFLSSFQEFVVSRLVVVLAVSSLAFAPAPLPRRERAEPPDVSGSWIGNDWGTVEIRKTRAGQFEGTYSDTYGKVPGRIHLTWDAKARRFVGTWHEGQDRFGDLTAQLLPDRKAVKGEFRADPGCKINGGNPRQATLQWGRSVP